MSALARSDPQAIADFLKAEVAIILDLSPSEINIDVPFSDLGLSSTDGLDLLGKVEDEIGSAIDVADFYQYPTIRALSLGLARGEDACAHHVEPTHERDGGGIAIIGMGCRYPGAETPRQLWGLFADGIDVIGHFPRERLGLSGVSSPRRQGGYLDDIAGFDAAYFGLAPDEVRHMDPMQRLLLEVAVDALDDAGIDPRALDGQRCGVVIGVSGSEFALASLSGGSASVRSRLTGSAPSFCANRLSYFFDWSGPSLVVDTACSSSATAVHQACDLLALGTVDLIIAGGANLILSDQIGEMLDSMGALSTTERCMTMDARASGYVRGEGIGLVVLKRLADARRDRDRSYALIEGWAMNNDGRSNGITAPNGRAQKEVVSRACSMAGVAPSRIDFFELHGTGTALGDPIEVNALSDLTGPQDGDDRTVLMGSAKTNLGHLEAASGILGIHKAALALYHEIVPSTLHFISLNEKIAIGGTALRPALQPHALKPGKRYGGVSSFGIGGSNAHFVLGNTSHQHEGQNRPDMPLLLSAETPDGLARFARGCAELLASGTCPEALAFSLACRRRHYTRRAVVPMHRDLNSLVAHLLTVADAKDAPANLLDIDGGAVVGAAVTAWANGQDPDFSILFPAGGNFTPYPGYPFARSAFWPSERHDDVGVRATDPDETNGIVTRYRHEARPIETIVFDREAIRPGLRGQRQGKHYLLLHDSRSHGFAEIVRDRLNEAFPDVIFRCADLKEANFQQFVEEGKGDSGLLFVSDERMSPSIDQNVISTYQPYHDIVVRAVISNLDAPCSLLILTDPNQLEPQSASASPLAALFRTLRVEIPRLAGAVIFATSEEAVDANLIMDVLEVPANRNTDVELDIDGAFNLVPRVDTNRERVKRFDLGFDFDHAVALSGGTGGLGLVFAQWALEGGAGEVLLIARNPASMQDEPEFHALCALAKQKNASVKLIACDVADAHALRAAMDSTPHLPVSTIIHLAGIPCGGAIRTVQIEAIEAAVRVKRDGAIALENAFGSDALKCFIAVSSPAARLGLYSQGGVGYAVANAALESYMARRDQGRGASLVMEWGPWRRIGMAARSRHSSELEKAGIAFIDPEDALVVLRDCRFSPNRANIIVGADGALSPSDGAIGVQADTTMRRELERLTFAERSTILTLYLRDTVARFLERSAEEIDPSAELASLGLDSINAIDFKIEIEERLAVEISFHALLDGSTIHSVASMIAKQIEGDGCALDCSPVTGARHIDVTSVLSSKLGFE
ncbi:3-oxoacyl-(acyl-carrier-protein) synthase/acyl carrier protein/short-subunit dehydrogenase involved in D-alanine esterification of teichoic acids [Sphingobium subterraneum]|uniref:3-oxoacyl-(Acyl-carrier-protein) synthase/acyl carrier protein/short-subunit dehydrogenase involved in D-alanine esterification of teichoic acids n=1 Tax=Sphingobium subterraneum TaxID=627688 RepID=A0A841IW33_9SPHN|nr:3-oxoacyl-(acyl-carrier-protein) synthase/acyl carrier protein/short-subunit dehydrogenase involved in D-alanine esterification of teichoic acids [Sphingobium subterraneum]